MFTELRKWFSSVCDCDGLNNLHEPQLECMNDTMGVLASAVYHEGDSAATTLIDLARANMQSRNMSSVYLPSGLMVCLNPYCEWECDISSSGGGYGVNYSQQDIIIYVKIPTNCQNYIAVRCSYINILSTLTCIINLYSLFVTEFWKMDPNHTCTLVHF